MVAVDPVGKALRQWLEEALTDPKTGKPKMTMEQLVERSGVYKGSLYRIKMGRSQRPEPTTLARLARVLGVDPPHIEREVSYEPPPEPETPAAMIRAAIRLLEQAHGEMEARPTKRKAGGRADPAAEIELAEPRPRKPNSHRSRRQA